MGGFTQVLFFFISKVSGLILNGASSIISWAGSCPHRHSPLAKRFQLAGAMKSPRRPHLKFSGNLLFSIVFSLVVSSFLGGCAFVEKKEAQLQIKSAVYSNNEKLSYCYKLALEENNNLEGEIHLEWDVSYLTGQERVQNVFVSKTTIRSETLSNCMKKAVANMRFNLKQRSQKKTFRVSYPFVFTNDKQNSLKR